ncbi:MAG: penicillin-binding protein [Clostridia bacterium]|nr:penicillin-binding protein [Clostridia bacterium]
MTIINKRIIAVFSIIFIFIFFVGILMFSMFAHSDEYALKSVNYHLYESGVLLNAGDIVDVNGNKLAYTENGERKYSDDSSIRAALLHIIGDNQGFIDGGIQDTFRVELCNYNLIYGVNSKLKNKVRLTLDSELCAYSYNQLLPYKGCVAVCNYKTGELVCIASSPSYDMFDKPSDMENNPDYEGVYINRLYGGLFTPGSVFKLVTSLGAIENIDDIHTRTFTCTGSFKTGQGTIICNDIHGQITFDEALKYSCNSVFAQIAIEMGYEKLQNSFDKAGLGQSYKNCDRIKNNSGKFRLTNESTSSDIGWTAIGQGDTLINPYSFLTFVCAIANNGQAYLPYFVASAESSSGNEVYYVKPELADISINETTAKTLKEMMRKTVNEYYGDYRFGNLVMCGKTGTAERDNEKPHAWFAGFSYDEKFPYAIVTVIENSGSGLQYAGTASSNILQKLYSQLY